MRAIFLLPTAMFGVGVGILINQSHAPTPTVCEKPVAAAEVSDLVARLVPLVKDPSSEWNGLAIVFSGDHVSIRVRTKNDNEYNARSRTLPGAVQMLTAPSQEIQAALNGWRQ